MITYKVLAKYYFDVDEIIYGSNEYENEPNINRFEITEALENKLSELLKTKRVYSELNPSDEDEWQGEVYVEISSEEPINDLQSQLKSFSFTYGGIQEIATKHFYSYESGPGFQTKDVSWSFFAENFKIIDVKIEEKLEESMNNNQIKEEIINLLNYRNYTYDIIESYPLTIRLEGDWKHDHARFKMFLNSLNDNYEWYSEEDPNDVDDGDDYYSAYYIIKPKKVEESINSFNEEEFNKLKEKRDSLLKEINKIEHTADPFNLNPNANPAYVRRLKKEANEILRKMSIMRGINPKEIGLEESNQLKKMAKFNRKHNKGKGWFVKLDAGNVPLNNAIFNSGVGVSETWEPDQDKDTVTADEFERFFSDDNKPKHLTLDQWHKNKKASKEDGGIRIGNKVWRLEEDYYSNDGWGTFLEGDTHIIKFFDKDGEVVKRVVLRNSEDKDVESTFETYKKLYPEIVNYKVIKNPSLTNESINIKESLNDLDSKTYCEYDLLNSYNAIKWDEKSKNKLIEKLVENKSVKAKAKELNKFFESFMSVKGFSNESLNETYYPEEEEDDEDLYINSEWADLDDERYKYIKSKAIMDSDGFNTEYTMYKDTVTGNFVFVFGDSDIYTPESGDLDYITETEQEAENWFNNYEGFSEEEDLDESLSENKGFSRDEIEKKVRRISNKYNAADGSFTWKNYLIEFSLNHIWVMDKKDINNIIDEWGFKLEESLKVEKDLLSDVKSLFNRKALDAWCAIKVYEEDDYISIFIWNEDVWAPDNDELKEMGYENIEDYRDDMSAEIRIYPDLHIEVLKPGYEQDGYKKHIQKFKSKEEMFEEVEGIIKEYDDILFKKEQEMFQI